MTTSIWNMPGTLANLFWERDWDNEPQDEAPIPIYDMHAHMGSHNAIYMKHCDAPDMVRHIRRIGIRRLVFSHHHALLGDMRSAQICKICSDFPDILRFYILINPHRPAFIDEDLEQYDAMKPFVFGLKFHPDSHHTAMTDPAYAKALAFANERCLPILVHTWGGSRFNGTEQMELAALDYPQITFLMGHSISGDWDGAARIAQKCPNALFELTSIPGRYGVIERLVKDIGSERIIYGTDCPWFDEFQHVGGVLSADITDDDKRNIFYRNVERLFGRDW